MSVGIDFQKGVLRSLVRSKQPVKDANPRISNFVSLIAGILIAVLIAVGAFILLVSQQ